MVFLGPTTCPKALPNSNTVTHLKQFQAQPVPFEMTCIEMTASDLGSYLLPFTQTHEPSLSPSKRDYSLAHIFCPSLQKDRQRSGKFCKPFKRQLAKSQGISTYPPSRSGHLTRLVEKWGMTESIHWFLEPLAVSKLSGATFLWCSQTNKRMAVASVFTHAHI